MLTSLESELQSGDALGLGSSSSSSTGLGGQQYGRSGIGGAANPNSSHLQLFNRPGFCSTLREFAHELQHSSRGLSGNLGSSSEQSGAHGLNLLHTTAVRRRSSLSELYNAARRRSSLSDLIQSLGGPVGQQQNGHSGTAAAAGADAAGSDMNGYSSGAANMSLSASGRKRSRAELDFDNPSSSRNMSFGLGISSGTGGSNNWGLDTVGAMLRPSIISALTSLNEEHAQQSSSSGSGSGSGSAGADGSSSGDCSGAQRQCSITDWMDGYYLDDAIRDLEATWDTPQSGGVGSITHAPFGAAAAATADVSTGALDAMNVSAVIGDEEGSSDASNSQQQQQQQQQQQSRRLRASVYVLLGMLQAQGDEVGDRLRVSQTHQLIAI
eukprot:17469-Heterococcus_DN1.PRE.1